MNVLSFSDDNTKFEIAILIKTAAFNKGAIENYYISPLEKLGIGRERVIAIELYYGQNNKVTAKDGKAHLQQVLNAADSLGVKTLVVADNQYFKFLTKFNKTSGKLGTVTECNIDKYTHMHVILSTNYQAMHYNDNMRFSLDQSLDTVFNFLTKNQTEVGTDIIHSAQYPTDLKDISNALKELHKHPTLTCDIEAFSLRYEKAGIGTISFAWNQHSGIAFDVSHTRRTGTDTIFRMLREFFESYKGEMIFHRGIYDVKVLVYTLYMTYPKDYEGMLFGLNVFKDFHDSIVLLFIATNSTAGNVLNLKENALEFAGDCR